MSEQTAIAPIDHTRLQGYRSSWGTALASYAEVPCDSAEGEAFWVQVRNAVHDAIQTLETERKEIALPIDRELKALNKTYREAREPAEALKELANKKLAEYAVAIEATRNAALVAATDAAKAGDTAQVSEALAVAAEAHTTASGNTVRYSWKWSVEDVSQLPGLYTKVVANEDAIAEYISRLDEGFYPHLPGVKFERVAAVRPTGKRK